MTTMVPTEYSEFLILLQDPSDQEYIVANETGDTPYQYAGPGMENGGEIIDIKQHYNHDLATTTANNLSSGMNGSVPGEGQFEHGLPEGSRIILILLYSLTTVMAVVGNIIVIIVFTLGWRSRTDLRSFLINLAVADLIMAMFCMPFTFTFTMLGDWVFSAPMCPIVLYMQTVSVTVSVFTNMAIGIDRFWVVLYPLKSRITKSRSKFVIALVWVTSLTICSVQLWVGRMMQDEATGRRECAESWPQNGGNTMRMVYTFFILLSTYLIPLTILSLTYGFVGRKLCKRTAPGNADEMRDTQQLKSKRKVIKMLVVVVLLFGICWLPLHVFILVIDFNPDLLDYQTTQQEQFFTALYYSVHWLAMSNSFVNPIIYGFLNDSFRHDLRRLIRMWCPCFEVCFKCLKDPTLLRNPTRGYSYCDKQSCSEGGSFKVSSKHRGGCSATKSAKESYNGKKQLSVKINGYGVCKTGVRDPSESFLLRPCSNTTNTSRSMTCSVTYSLPSPDTEEGGKLSPTDSPIKLTIGLHDAVARQTSEHCLQL